MSPALIGQLSWPTIVLIVLLFQALIIWRLRVRVRDLEEYEFWFYQQPQPVQQPRRTLQPLRRPR